MKLRLGRFAPIALLKRALSAWGRISPYLGASRWKMAALGVCAVGAGLVEAALLALIAAIAAGLSSGRSDVNVDLGPLAIENSLSTLFVVGFALALARTGFQTLMAYLPSSMSANAMAMLRQRLFDAFSDASWEIQASERDGHFQALMGGHVGKTSQAIVTVGQAMSAFFMFSTLVATAFVLSLPTALILLFSTGALFLVMRPLTRRTRRYSAILSKENIEYSKGIQEVVRMAEETQAFGASDFYRSSVHELIEQVRFPLLRSQFLSKLVPVIYQSVALMLLLFALVVVSFLGGTRIASLGAVVLILIRSMSYGQQMQSSLTRMNELAPFMSQLGKSIRQYLNSPMPDGDRPLPAINSIGMRKVDFSYVPDTKVLKDFEFDVRAGEAIGIVGPSGAGKSTLVQLLLRLRDPDDGMLHVNGEDARQFLRSDWQHRVAYVPQSPQLLWGTVADNIRYYRPELTDDDVELAARLAHIHDEIMSWPQGYDSIVGQRASAVSGGQRQRLCIARALAAQPDVLILDEPTSALDVKSEVLVQESLRSLKGDVILFMVAHRLSTLSICNRVMVIVDGELEAIDSPSRLLERNAFYREVIEITQEQTAI